MTEVFDRARVRLRRGWPAVLLLPVIFTALFGTLERRGTLTELENLSYDTRLRWLSGPPRKSQNVVVVGLDSLTIHGIQADPEYRLNYGNWPYNRSLWSRVIEELTADGARAVVMDLTLDETGTDPSGDENMAQTIREKRVPFYAGLNVSAFTETGESRELPTVKARNIFPEEATRPEPPAPSGGADFAEPASPSREEVAQALAFPVMAKAVLPVPLTQLNGSEVRRAYPIAPIAPLLRVASGFGLVETDADADGFLRRVRFSFSDGNNLYVPLPVAVAADYFHAEKLELSPGRLRLGNRSLAINPAGDASLDFGGALQARFETVPLLYLLNDWVHRSKREPLELKPSLFKDKIVVIGAFALGLHDAHPTPFATDDPGVVKQAAEIDTLLGGRFIVDAPAWVNLGLALGVALFAVALMVVTGSTAVELLWPPSSLIPLFWLTGLALARSKLHIDFAYPAFTLGASALGAIAFNHLVAQREGKQIKSMFSRYLAKQVVDQLVRNPERLRLDGENVEITAFFSDIRGFSTFSERFRDDPKGLVSLLNTYLTRVSGVLQSHGGCLDKYIGDAVVCLFGAPLSQADHAVRACRAALEVQAEVKKIREEFAARGLPDVYTRIGMNSAVMFVGNFGSEQLFNYTAMGDGMNLASRLEGANKSYDSLIMVGPRTYELAKDFVEARELDRVRVAGKTEAVTVYELLALKGELSEARLRVCSLYAEALAHFRAQSFPKSAQTLDRALEIFADDGPSQKLLRRCKSYMESPPCDFDGVANLDK